MFVQPDGGLSGVNRKDRASWLCKSRSATSWVIPAFYPIQLFDIPSVGDADIPWLKFLAEAVMIQSRWERRRANAERSNPAQGVRTREGSFNLGWRGEHRVGRPTGPGFYHLGDLVQKRGCE